MKHTHSTSVPVADAAETGGEAPDDREYARALGGRLRAVRSQQRLSLHGVERKSGGKWKAEPE